MCPEIDSSTLKCSEVVVTPVNKKPGQTITSWHVRSVCALRQRCGGTEKCSAQMTSTENNYMACDFTQQINNNNDLCQR